MKKFLVLLSVLAAFFLTACDEGITEGEIYEKKYSEAYTTMNMTPMYGANGQITGYIPSTQYWDEEFVLKLRDCSRKNEDKECFTGNIKVDQGTFNQVNVGDSYPPKSEGK